MREKKRLLMASVVILAGIGLFTPSYTSMAAEQIESQIQMGQIIKGTVSEDWGNEIIVKGNDGKRYHVGLYTFSEEQISALNISIGSTVQIEGEVLSSLSDLYDFNYFVKTLPLGVTEDEIKVLEKLYNKIMVLERKELWEESGKVWMQINEITNPYYLKNWEPEPFEIYISMFEYSFSSDDLIQMEELYNQWISLAKGGKEEESSSKMNQLFDIVGSYYVEPTFDEYVASMDIIISKDDYPLIKKLYEDASQASIDEDEQLSMAKWQAFDLAMRPYHRAAYPMPTFEEQMSYNDFEVSEEDYVKLQKLYTAILDLEQTGKYDDLDSQWELYYSILEPYHKINESIPFRALQVIIDGETFHSQK